MFNSILSYVSKIKYYLIFGLILIASLLVNITAIKSCSNYKEMNNNNIIALTDSIHYYQNKNGELIASKRLLMGDMSTLKLANDSLYNVLKDMKVSKPNSVVYIQGEASLPQVDTMWIVQKDSLNKINKEFAFNDDYRSLEGNVYLVDDTLGLNVAKDEVYFDYVVAIENNQVLLKSNNPYIKYKEITGLTVPNQVSKKKHWSIGIGPNVSYGYDFNNRKFAPMIGIGVQLNYNLFSW